MIRELITEVVIFICLAGGMVYIAQNWINTAKNIDVDSVINEVLPAIRSILLYLMSEAEEAWQDYEKSGAIKKSQVITMIYEKFPVLHKVADQDYVVEQISQMIENEMDELRTIMSKNIKSE